MFELKNKDGKIIGLWGVEEYQTIAEIIKNDEKKKMGEKIMHKLSKEVKDNDKTRYEHYFNAE